MGGAWSKRLSVGGAWSKSLSGLGHGLRVCLGWGMV